MLPKINRLPRPEVKALMRSSKRRTIPGLTVVYRKNPAGGPPRLSCIVSTTIDKRATVRNRTKRLIREVLQKLLPEVPRGTDGAIIVRRKIETHKEAEIGIRGLVLCIKELNHNTSTQIQS